MQEGAHDKEAPYDGSVSHYPVPCGFFHSVPSRIRIRIEVREDLRFENPAPARCLSGNARSVFLRSKHGEFHDGISKSSHATDRTLQKESGKEEDSGGCGGQSRKCSPRDSACNR